MITYLLIRYILEDACDYEDLFSGMVYLPISLIGDIVCILIQPIIYIAYLKWKSEGE